MNLAKDRSCAGKARHHNRRRANAALRKIVKRRGVPAGDLVSYACPHCGGWHVGHPLGGQP